MNTNIITNKYALSLFVILCLFLLDVALHSGMSRVIAHSSFYDRIAPINLPVCAHRIVAKDKNWASGITKLILQKLPVNIAGIQCDLYYDQEANIFRIANDRSTIDEFFEVYSSKKLSAAVWLTLKNINNQNLHFYFTELMRLKNKFGGSQKIMIESTAAELLRSFCDSGILTTYRVPVFDPYRATEYEIKKFADSVRSNLRAYPASAISADYLQYPALKKFFPNYPILTWVALSPVSVVSYVLRRQLEKDEHITVILTPFKE
ncbi:MAG: hypothetical protein ABIO04_00395 [Ferruginibacter sp.]